MLVNLNEIMEYANKHEVAIGAFNTPTLQMIKAVIQSSESLNLPVIIQHAPGHNSLATMEEIGPIMIEYARNARIPVCVHLDHGDTFNDCVKAMKLGFTSVMYDASSKPFEVNVRETQEIVKIARTINVSVEAELGQMLNSTIGAGEGRSSDSSGYQYTDPNLAREFVERTDVDCLAVAVGTVHGIYIEKPHLNLKRVQEIHDEIKRPIVLHGGSGLSTEDYRIAIKNGVRKINFYTYMNKAAGEAIEKHLKSKPEYVFFDELSQIATQAMIDTVSSVMKTFANLDV